MTAAPLVRPPSSNTGANLSPHPSSPALKLASDLHFDWYDATIPTRPGALSAEAVASVLAEAVVGRAGTLKRVPGVNGYARGIEVVGVENGSVVVYDGGTEAMGVHVKGTSAAAVPVAAALRSWWPDHRVSRVDVALDFDSPGSFDALWPVVREVARSGSSAGGRKVSTRTEGDWLDREKGRTLYAGSRSSRCMLRVYEKGHEQLARDPLCGASLDWSRVEWQVRPDTGQKVWAASASPLDLLSVTPMGAALARALLALDLEPVAAVRRGASQDPEVWAVRQYRRTVEAWVQLEPESVIGRHLRELLAVALTPADELPVVAGSG